MASRRSYLRRMIPAFGLALIASLALGALAAGSASATTQHWYSCKNVGASSGGYASSACQEPSKGNFEWSELSAATSSSMKGTAPLTVLATISGIKFYVSCTSAQANGSAENPSGGGAGRLTFEGIGSLAFTGCTVLSPEPTTCQVKEGKIAFNAVTAEATEFEGAPAIKFQPAEGTTLAGVTLEGCKKTLFNGTKLLAGSVYGVSSNTSGDFEFTQASTSKYLTWGGQAAILAGKAKLETESGEALRAGLASPVNYSLPTITPHAPEIGTVASVSTGGWANLPTSYTYQWKICFGKIECFSISEATKSTYTVAKSDGGHTLEVEVTATNSRGSKTVISELSGVIPPEPPPWTPGAQYWYACEEVAPETGTFEESKCQGILSQGSYEWLKLAEGAPSGFTWKNTSPIKINYTLGYNTITVECSTEEGSGTLTNPKGGEAGTLQNTAGNYNSVLNLSGCVVHYWEPSKCEIKQGIVTSAVLTGTATEFEKGPAIMFGKGSEVLFGFEVVGCGNYLMNGWKAMKGTLMVSLSRSGSRLEFSKAGSSGISFERPAWIEGTANLETSAGGAVRLSG